MSNKIKVVRKRPGEAPEVVEIENSESAFEAEVGGAITTVYPLSDVKFVRRRCNRVDELPKNLLWCGVDLRGVILFVGWDARKKCFCDVPNAQFWLDGVDRWECNDESQSTEGL